MCTLFQNPIFCPKTQDIKTLDFRPHIGQNTDQGGLIFPNKKNYIFWTKIGPLSIVCGVCINFEKYFPSEVQEHCSFVIATFFGFFSEELKDVSDVR